MAQAEGTDPGVVVVTGDVTTDWNLARVPEPPGPERVMGPRGTTHASVGSGGAGLLSKLVAAVAADVQKHESTPIEVRTVGVPPDTSGPTDRRSHHSFAIWSEFEHPKDKNKKVWRIAEMLGLDPAPFDSSSAPEWASVVDDPARADLVVLDDAGLGFRDNQRLWPQAISAPDSSPWIVLKMARQVADGNLWTHLQSRLDRVIAVVRIDDLRLTEAQISRELSWERTAQDLMWELTFNREVRSLARCAHVIVSFSTAGALLLSRPPPGAPSEAPRAKLIFDPLVMEDQWVAERPGGMVGYTCCLTSAIARAVMLSPENPKLERAIQRGIEAMRVLHLDGYEVDNEAADPEAVWPRLEFPFDRVVDELAKDAEPFAEAPVRDPTLTITPVGAAASEPRPWTILEEVYREGLEQVARRIVLEGPDDVIEKVPVGRFGKLLTVDRQEIEGFRSIRSLIWQYSRKVRPERPLSIAVFGRPGSGKSFGIKQMALSMLPDLIEVLTFNLSQFHDPSQILDALHQVRDRSLKGKLPLVFWDEFDATLGDKALGWLRHFLAPMQDGEFQDGQVTHHIGPAIFVFAGGTKHTMQEFRSQESDDFIDRKGPDFVSRLKGFVNILGPDPVHDDPEQDPHYIIRRAILLRTMLAPYKRLFRDRELQIDSGVWRAFLRARRYEHGARSMESIIAMSLLDGRSRFERSCLPSEEQLALHVDPRDFLDLVRSLVIEGKLLEELAEAVHVQYCATELEKGAKWAEESADYLRSHPALKAYVKRDRDSGLTLTNLVAFENLPDDIKEQNRDVARDIPNKLEAVGYEARQSREREGTIAFPSEVVELLAEKEHDRWMRLKLATRWSYGPKKDNDALLHPDLLAWSDLSQDELVEHYGADDASRIGPGALPEKEKDKDRTLIEAVTSILAGYGYYVRKIEPPAEQPGEAPT